MTDSYKQSIEESKATLRALVEKRDEISFNIDRLQTVITALANMLDNPKEKLAELTELSEILGPSGLTEAVSMIVKASLNGFSATQVRDALEAGRFDLSRYSNALAAIHTTLKRLDVAGKVKAVPNQTGETIYQWNESVGARVHPQGIGRKQSFIRQGISDSRRVTDMGKLSEMVNPEALQTKK